MLFSSWVCQAEDNSAPAKFYDSIVIQPEKSVYHYTVKNDQSLADLAGHLQLSVLQLAVWNDMSPSQRLSPGQKVKIFKNKQKHSPQDLSQALQKIPENMRDISQKTSIISINNKSMLKLYCHWPTAGKMLKNFSQTRGKGIEISGKLGQPIQAAAAGQVVAIGAGIYGHGSFVVVQHQDQYLSSYANNRNILVKNGQTVKQGQVIAEMGQAGHQPPSLEFEIRKNGQVVNPLWFLPKKR